MEFQAHICSTADTISVMLVTNSCQLHWTFTFQEAAWPQKIYEESSGLHMLSQLTIFNQQHAKKILKKKNMWYNLCIMVWVSVDK